MIEGLKILVTGREIHDHAETRAAHHRNRLDFYSGQLKTFEDDKRKMEVEEGLNKSSYSNDPREHLRSKAFDHGKREAYFRFVAGHVNLEETYLLSNQELNTIEIT